MVGEVVDSSGQVSPPQSNSGLNNQGNIGYYTGKMIAKTFPFKVVSLVAQKFAQVLQEYGEIVYNRAVELDKLLRFPAVDAAMPKFLQDSNSKILHFSEVLSGADSEVSQSKKFCGKDGRVYIIKPVGGAIATLHDWILRKIGLNENAPKLEQVSFDILPINGDKVIRAIGQRRQKSNAKSIFDSYPGDEEKQNEAMKKHIAENKSSLIKLYIVGIADIEYNVRNVFLTKEGGYQILDLDGLCLPSFPILSQFEDFKINQDDFKEALEFMNSDLFKELKEEKLRFMKDFSSEEFYESHVVAFDNLHSFLKEMNDKINNGEIGEANLRHSSPTDRIARKYKVRVGLQGDVSEIFVNGEGGVVGSFLSISSNDRGFLKYETINRRFGDHPTLSTKPYFAKGHVLRDPEAENIQEFRREL